WGAKTEIPDCTASAYPLEISARCNGFTRSTKISIPSRRASQKFTFRNRNLTVMCAWPVFTQAGGVPAGERNPMLLRATTYRLLVLQAVLSSVACLAQAASPSQFASPSDPVQAATGLMDNSPCQAVTGGNQQLAPLAKLCEFALNYQRELPDFLAEMTTTERRSRLTTIVTAQVTLKQGHESYAVMTVNGKPVDVGSVNDMPKVPMRFTSSGEFGALLVDLFHPGEAEFEFRKQATLHGTPVVVYDFHVPASSNKFWSLTDDFGHTLHPELQGELWVEAGTGRLMRESLQPVHLPAGFEI